MIEARWRMVTGAPRKGGVRISPAGSITTKGFRAGQTYFPSPYCFLWLTEVVGGENKKLGCSFPSV
jgi:hypothetical protein